MSWMDSWSRPSKSQVTPPPLYLTAGDTVPYCRSCGRVIGQRKSHASQEVKYCSARCRNTKPGPIDRKIESVFAALLDGASPESLRDDDDGEVRSSKGGRNFDGKQGKQKKRKAVKGDPRIIVECGTVEELVFPRGKDPEKIYGRRKNRAARGIVEKPEDWRSVDMVDGPAPAPGPTPRPSTDGTSTTSDKSARSDDEDGGVALEMKEEEVDYGYGGGKIRPPQTQSDINGSIGGEKGWAERIEETDEMKAKRQEGQRRAEEKERVRRAARRWCAFGLQIDGEGAERKCEAVMKGVVVEASFAKGEWGIRWRDKS
ncbi:hypothetical protein BU26DRAFT_509151 [Trematosphaeria pertusa]|uniref:Uncharacterized protein n=1 Tax=Trematosphaeria pertusa TaxID=390896 RepID=A0A6A6I188_9PLEO|nr:uncharacterized protein BU26DRAFT_509151 [Trematosphaeria pertusa]KAF2244215.1 hypothetical protein BU26DRAFT_509151 [Trematosphaeria pertusa]